MIGICPEHYWNTEKVAFKHKKIIGNTSAFICQNNQTPSCDETNQKDPIIVDQTKSAGNWWWRYTKAPGGTLICFDTSLIPLVDHIWWTIFQTLWSVDVKSLCTIFTQHRYKISRSQRHQLRIIISFVSADDNDQHFFQLTIIIRIFLLPTLGSSSPLVLVAATCQSPQSSPAPKNNG